MSNIPSAPMCQAERQTYVWTYLALGYFPPLNCLLWANRDGTNSKAAWTVKHTDQHKALDADTCRNNTVVSDSFWTWRQRGAAARRACGKLGHRTLLYATGEVRTGVSNMLLLEVTHWYRPLSTFIRTSSSFCLLYQFQLLSPQRLHGIGDRLFLFSY